MPSESIQINVGAEQDVVIPYGNQRLRFQFRFNDYFNNWFFNLLNQTTGETISSGVALTIGFDAFFGLGFKYGSLILTDTKPNSATPVSVKADFGSRLQLVRNYGN